ncbi:hypothetical protein NH8B_0594 [Pseudogulbenkiania sp. NH8B]|uniref:hypothetical protein n=1 Tax=Pseudogulbenkiania sp. (strain NH8B) TaxID=748280 RepID=UPI0002279592|nr:hypothetical protein [Pseudogulbenkiania sp. NH8B]BAK75429.1 hypothetical protein NH8B_0594 [Pseudogulbenkiania sp. NH8B]
MSQAKERPILFSAPMVRALLAGQKTQTRFIVKPQPDHRTTKVSIHRDQWMGNGPSGNGVGTAQWDPWRKSPFAVGDRLWVRQTWHIPGIFNAPTACTFARSLVRHALDNDNKGASQYQRAMLMPRWASRILLEIVDVRAERLQDIREADALAEGVKHCESELDTGGNWYAPEELYSMLWTKINGWGASGWNANPWVWVVEFRRIEG